MKNVDIFGTDVSYELFNYTDSYLVNTYMTKQSIYTIDCNPYMRDIDRNMLANDMLYYDFNKSAFSVFANNPAEYLIIDFSDQLRDVLVLDNHNNVKLTDSVEAIKELDILNERYHIEDIDNYDINKLYTSMELFVQKISSMYARNKIILNTIQLPQERQEILKLLESMFFALVPECKVLFSKYIIDGDLYYEYRMKLLDAVINNSNIDDIEKWYFKKYNSGKVLAKKKN